MRILKNIPLPADTCWHAALNSQLQDGMNMRVALGVIGVVLVSLIASLSCDPADEASVEESTPEAEAPAEQEERETEELNAADIAEELKEGGLPITYPITDVGFEQMVGSPAAGLISHAVTASDSVEIDVDVFDSPEARRAVQEERARNLERARAEMEPGVLPAFMADASCGPILVELTQLTDSGEGREQQRQAQQILEERFGPC